MLSSEKSIFENYDCVDPCQRKNAAVMVKTMHQNGLHDILPVLYKVASILATIPATLCSAERSFSALRRIKTFLRFTSPQQNFSRTPIEEAFQSTQLDIELSFYDKCFFYSRTRPRLHEWIDYLY